MIVVRILFLKCSRLHIDAIVADAARSASFGTRQILESAKGVVLAQVDDELVWEGRLAVGAPIGALLQVEDLVGSLVAVGDVLIVGIVGLPRLTTQALALLVEHIPFGDTGDALGHLAFGCLCIVHIERLDADVTTRDRLIEANFLPTIAGSETTFLDRLLAAEVEVLALLAMRLWPLEVEAVDDGLLESFGHSYCGTKALDGV